MRSKSVEIRSVWNTDEWTMDLPDVDNVDRFREIDAVPAGALVSAELNVISGSLSLMPSHDQNPAMVSKVKHIGMISDVLPANTTHIRGAD